MSNVPTFILILVLWSYWLGVLTMICYAAQGNFRTAGMIPKQRLERILWLCWLPIIIAWNTLPILALTKNRPLSTVPHAGEFFVLNAVRWMAAIISVFCLLGTIVCWRRLGRNWSIAVVPKRAPKLVTDGLYEWVRHPIYALTIVLMLCSVVIVPTVLMVILALFHVLLVRLKARNEERFLLQVLGRDYARYCHRTGRFFPRLVTRSSDLGSHLDGRH